MGFSKGMIAMKVNTVKGEIHFKMGNLDCGVAASDELLKGNLFVAFTLSPNDQFTLVKFESLECGQFKV